MVRSSIALLCLLALPDLSAAPASDNDPSLRFINVRDDNDQHVAIEKMIATAEEWGDLLRPSMKNILLEKHNVSRFTSTSVKFGECWVLSTITDEDEGEKYYVDRTESLAEAKEKAIERANQKYHPRRVVGFECHNSKAKNPYIIERSLNCGNGSEVSIKTTKYTDILLLQSSSGKKVNLNLNYLSERIRKKATEIKALQNKMNNEPVVLVDGKWASKYHGQMKNLQRQYGRLTGDYDKKYSNAVTEACFASDSDKRSTPNAEALGRRLIEWKKDCKYSSDPDDTTSCNYVSPLFREKGRSSADDRG